MCFVESCISKGIESNDTDHSCLISVIKMGLVFKMEAVSPKGPAW